MVKDPSGPPDDDSKQKKSTPRRRAMQLPLNAPPTSSSAAEKKRRGWQAPGTAPAFESSGRASAADAGPHRPFTPGVAREMPARAAAKPRAAARRGGFRVPLARRHPAVISQGEKTLFWTLLAAVLAMSIFLVRYRERVNEHFAERSAVVPLASAGENAPTSSLTLYLANDATGSLMQRTLEYPLPQDLDVRARVVLDKLLAEYSATGSPHPLKPLAPGVEGVDEVFLLPVPGEAKGRNELAVVDLTPNFVHWHPSGIEPETMTLLSLIATLHANLPRVTQVRFLVDGEPSPTLAGHADLTQTYLAGAGQMSPREAFAVSGAPQ